MQKIISGPGFASDGLAISALKEALVKRRDTGGLLNSSIISVAERKSKGIMKLIKERKVNIDYRGE